MKTRVLGLSLFLLAMGFRPAAGADHERILYRFQAGQDGEGPVGALVSDSSGALYGTTSHGGGSTACPDGCGTVFKLTPAQGGFVESVLYRFKGGHDGASPFSGVILDDHGTLFGTTMNGGTNGCNRNGCGTVFALQPAGSRYREKILYRFAAGTDGAVPTSGLLLGADGTLYGTTTFGGSDSACYGAVNGCGTAFSLAPGSSGYKEAILYRFAPGTGGNQPSALIALADGSFVGTTLYGGATDCGFPADPGCGTVFRLARSSNGYAEAVIHAFAGRPNDGSSPSAEPIFDASGALFGTTYEGGSGQPCQDRAGCGIAFALTPAGSGYAETIIHSFRKGGQPSGMIALNGSLYGTTGDGGTRKCDFNGRCGSIFKLAPTPTGYDLVVLHRFLGGNDGAIPSGNLLPGPHGVLYGTTELGGMFSQSPCCGTVFEIGRR